MWWFSGWERDEGERLTWRGKSGEEEEACKCRVPVNT